MLYSLEEREQFRDLGVDGRKIKIVVKPSATGSYRMYVVGSKSFRPDQLLKVTEIKQLCYFST